MGKGQTFLNTPDKTSRGGIRHLNIIITNPDDDNNVLVVPVCTCREKDGKPFLGQDLSCLLPAGCHPFIKEKSYIRYHHAKVMNLIDIFNGLNKGKLKRQEDIDIHFVQDMQRGAEESPFLPEKLKMFFEYFL
jgi:hypothetical protein